tara:strand:+ start:354 stop:671 length:318 start_codon:yes stop_codon:yes gene_type:complete
MVTVKDIEEISAFVNWADNPKEDNVLIVNYLTKESEDELKIMLEDALCFLYEDYFDGESVEFEIAPLSPQQANSTQLVRVPIQELDFSEWELVDLINKFNTKENE